jgi:hypothetical protein
VGFFFLPSFTAATQEKDIKIIDDTVANVEASSAPSSESPVWNIYLSTITVWPPASTSTIKALPNTSSETPTAPIIVASNGGECGPSAEVEICTEVDPAVCPIVP